MRADIETINTVQRRVKVAVPAEVVDKEYDKQLRLAQKSAQLKGFRPGKAPLALIRKVYGSYVGGDVVDQLIRSALPPILMDHKLSPVATPVVESASNIEEGKEFNFSVVIDIMPEVEIQDYKGLKISGEKYDVSQESLDRDFAALRRRHGTVSQADENAVVGPGTYVSFAHRVFRDDGTEVEHMNVENFSVAIGFKEIFADTEAALIGMIKGEEKEARISLPAEYTEAELAGKTLSFKFKINNIEKLTVPELNDEFAKDLGFKDLENLKSYRLDLWKRRADEATRSSAEKTLFDALNSRNSTLEAPPSMVDNIIDSQIENMGVKSADDLKKLKSNKELRERLLPEAKRQAVNSLMLVKIARQENITVNQEMVKEHLAKKYQMTNDDDIAHEMKNLNQNDEIAILFEKVIDFLISSAEVTYTAKSI